MTSILRTILPLKPNHEALFEIVGLLTHDFEIAVLKHVLTPDLDLANSGSNVHHRLGTQVSQLAAEILLVLRHTFIKRRRHPWIIPCRRPGVVIHKVHA
jgi:hypothetical protein